MTGLASRLPIWVSGSVGQRVDQSVGLGQHSADAVIALNVGLLAAGMDLEISWPDEFVAAAAVS
jgi:hypothetical protein